jgi:hypothetical protein
MDFASSLARNPNYRGILHWGQRNDCTVAEIEERFGHKLHRWRDVLARFTDNGRLDRFSSAFTRQVGLEVVAPRIGTVTCGTTSPGQPLTVEWDCGRNPPGTEVIVTVLSPSHRRAIHRPLPLAGRLQITNAAEPGDYRVRVVAVSRLVGAPQQRAQSIRVTVANS